MPCKRWLMSPKQNENSPGLISGFLVRSGQRRGERTHHAKEFSCFGIKRSKLVRTEKVTRRNITEVVVANGKIQPVTQVMISPEVAGEIVALPVKEGDHVKRGDLLLQIKPDNYAASRNSAEASYKSATAGKNL